VPGVVAVVGRETRLGEHMNDRMQSQERDRDRLLGIAARRDGTAVPMREDRLMAASAQATNSIAPRLVAALLMALLMSVTAAWCLLLFRGANWLVSY